MYITKQQFQAQPEAFKGEENNEPSKTIEGEFMEMKDILNNAMKGMNYPKTDAQYFRPDEIQQINSTYRASLDLTDLDSLRQKTDRLTQTLEKAQQRKAEDKAALQAEMKKNQSEPKTTEE